MKRDNNDDGQMQLQNQNQNQGGNQQGGGPPNKRNRRNDDQVRLLIPSRVSNSFTFLKLLTVGKIEVY